MILRFSVVKPLALFAVRPNDIWPDGAPTRVTVGLLYQTDRDGNAGPTPLVPFETYGSLVERDDIALGRWDIDRKIEDGPAEARLSTPAHPCPRGLLATSVRIGASITPRLATLAGSPRSGDAALQTCPCAPR